jgi:hypothetical protein
MLLVARVVVLNRVFVFPGLLKFWSKRRSVGCVTSGGNWALALQFLGILLKKYGAFWAFLLKKYGFCSGLAVTTLFILEFICLSFFLPLIVSF